MMKSIRYILLPLFILAAGSRAEAHAYLDHAEPKVGSTVIGSPSQVKVWFTMEVLDGQTAIQVFDASGKEVDLGDSKRDTNTKALVAVSVKRLPAGTYQVTWHAVCPFGHRTKGNYRFKIGKT